MRNRAAEGPQAQHVAGEVLRGEVRERERVRQQRVEAALADVVQGEDEVALDEAAGVGVVEGELAGGVEGVEEDGGAGEDGDEGERGRWRWLMVRRGEGTGW
ncbi:hypothetical protein MMC13_007333 [Lambiella insularis]|nr:hypothetical protein [Lambiella insularis]